VKTLFTNAKSPDDNSLWNLLVEDGIIVYKGDESVACDRKIDLGGAFVYPGFVVMSCL
jgi:cytosine/adenosine deaminase-related metal-dependent hydrolase